MNKCKLITAVSLILVGIIIFIGVMTVLDWDFNKLSTVKYETNTYEITESFKNIKIDITTADVNVLPSKADKTTVICYEKSTLKHSAYVDGETLKLELNDMRKWYERVGINFDMSKITVYLPEAEYESLTVDSSTGDINVSGNLSFNDLSISLSTGDVELNDIKSGSASISATTGDIEITDMESGSATISLSTGDIEAKNLLCENSLTISTTTGDVELEAFDAGEISITTSTGDIFGSILSEKIFITSTSTGKVSVPSSASGGKCELSTTTGDIKITLR